jgi:hypothetical protein
MTDALHPLPPHPPNRHARKEDAMSLEQLKQQLTAPPSAEELARRRAVFERIKAARQDRSIAPLTTADLVHQAREEEYRAYGGER